MNMRLKRSATGQAMCLLVLVATGFLNALQAQITLNSCQSPFDVLKQRKVASINIPNTNLIHGYFEKLPDDYLTTGNKKYPVIIYIHGVNETGSGSSTDLCKLLYEWNWWPPTLVEIGKFPYSVKDQNNVTHKFILISPQLVYYGDAPGTINALIDYVISTYRADPGRIYLTGISAGANFIDDYVSSSVANARRIAGLAPLAPCNTLSTQGAANIAQANLPVWAIQCSADNMCNGATAQTIVNQINGRTPAPTPAAYTTTLPVANYPCNPFQHNVWGTGYDTTFKQTINGRNVNLYEWFVQYTRTASGPLPVKLENYSVQLEKGKVKVRWTTSAEINNDHFSIERAGSEQRFSEIAVIPASGNSTGKTYEWTDDKPLTNLSYYRLTQTDADGRKENFTIKKILNRQGSDRSVIVSPNPFGSALTAFINLDRSQPVTISLTDISGKVLRRMYGVYGEGNAEINMKTSDLSTGIYVFRVEGEDFTTTQKVVKR